MSDGEEKDWPVEGPSAPRIDGELRIHNVLALALLESDRKIDLDEAAPLFINSFFDPAQFPAIRIEMRGPLTHCPYTVSLFEGGKIQSAGGCMPREAGMCMKRVARRLRQKLGLQIKFKNFEIHNLLAVVDVGCGISLSKLRDLAPGQKDFEPNTFPALRVTLPVAQLEEAKTSASQGDLMSKKRAAARLTQSQKRRKVESIMASIFANGKINFVGGKSVKSIVAMIDELRPFIEACTSDNRYFLSTSAPWPPRQNGVDA